LLNLSTENKTISYNDSTLVANRPTPEESPRVIRKISKRVETPIDPNLGREGAAGGREVDVRET
jgi:hypothetical protein